MKGLHNILVSTLTLLLLATPAMAGMRCFLHGSITDTSFTGTTKSKSQVTNMLRLQMDAKTVDYCQQMVSSYCRNNVLGKGDVPKKLEAYFTDEKDKRTGFSIDEKCNVKRSDDSAED